jgi:hypothetical protein
MRGGSADAHGHLLLKSIVSAEKANLILKKVVEVQNYVGLSHYWQLFLVRCPLSILRAGVFERRGGAVAPTKKTAPEERRGSAE